MKPDEMANINELAKETRRAYHKEWRSRPENREKKKLYNQNYWRKKALEKLQSKSEEERKTHE